MSIPDSTEAKPIGDHQSDLGATTRSRRLSLSFVTSIISKVGSIAVLAVAMPYAIRALGPERYGAYSTLVSGVAWLSVVNFGTGPALTRAIAKSAANRDAEDERRYFSNAVAMVLACATLVALILAGLHAMQNSGNVLGPAVSGFRSSTSTGIEILNVLVPLTMVASIADAIYVGHQEQYITNTWSLIYSLLSLPAYAAIYFWWPSIPAMVLAVYAPLMLTKIGGLVQLLQFRRPYLRFRSADVEYGLIKTLLLSGAAFFLLSAGTYLHTQLGVYIAAQQGSEPAAQMGVMMQISVLALNLVTMCTGPLWPALIDARERNDSVWLSRVMSKTKKITVVSALAFLIGFGTLSPFLASRWYHIPVTDPKMVGWSAGLYVATCAIENVLISIAIAFGALAPVSKIFLARTLVVSVLYFPAMKIFGISGIFLAASLSVIAGPIPLMMRAVSSAARR